LAGGDEDNGADRFKLFFVSGGELDLRGLDDISNVGDESRFLLFNNDDDGDDDDAADNADGDNSLPMLLHACAMRTSGFSFLGLY
jgi:hypothetical protein